jgi:hypothetical protein
MKIPCCEAGAPQYLRRIRGCDTRIRRESGAYITQMLRAKLAYMYMYIVRFVSCSPHTSCKCCAHLPREERATRDVTFGPLCTCTQTYATELKKYG